ncbi:MAG: hypothetical protein FD180_235 [Planctomycetota bacterium]|nr:MAG: hypothetical protein FD180_235 [Planctomycetota bacterium]
MRAKFFPIEKQRKLSQVDQKQFEAFVDEIPRRVHPELSSELPPIKGFRPKQEQTFLAQIKWVAKHLKGPERATETRKAMDAMRILWIAWTQAHEELNRVLLAFDNEADFSGPEAIPPNSPLDLGCFDELIAASKKGEVSQEEIRRFYDFGYFVVDDRIEERIKSARPRSELTALREVRDLPDTLEDFRKRLERYESGTAEEKQALEKLRQESRDLAKEAKSLNTTVEELKRNLGTVPTQSEVKECQDGLAQIREELRSLGRRMDTLEREAKSNTAGLGKVESRVETELLTKINAIQTKLVSVASHSNQVADANPFRPGALPTTQFRPASSGPNLESIDQWISRLTENFTCVGLSPVALRGLSREIVAACLAGQLPLLAGSAASLVARIVAESLGNSIAYRISIPVGLLGGVEFERSLDSVLEILSKQDCVGVVVLEGVNRSAIEAFGSRIYRLVSERVFGLMGQERQPVLLGTLIEGPSALDVSPVLTELGPILHTDALSWGGDPTPEKVVGGNILIKDWQRATTGTPSAPLERSQFDECWHAMSGPNSILWRRGLERSFQRISAMTKPSGPPGPLQSVVFGWLIPRAAACEIRREKFDKVLGDGRLGASTDDPRFKKLLGLHWGSSGGNS